MGDVIIIAVFNSLQDVIGQPFGAGSQLAAPSSSMPSGEAGRRAIYEAQRQLQGKTCDFGDLRRCVVLGKCLGKRSKRVDITRRGIDYPILGCVFFPPTCGGFFSW